ncbi:MAG TPA: GAF domain-containing protein [bacterium]|nr:GAF domain-containing protein [bacterium]
MAKILVVDDELFYREMVADVLKKEKHEVTIARDGKEAVELFERQEHDVALVDVVMPGFDGLLVLSKFKKHNPMVPVIMLSAHEDQRMVIQALRFGAFDYQRKPISPQELALAVERALNFKKLQVEQEKKLERLSSLESGAKRLSEMVAGEISLEAVAQEYELLDSAVKLVSELLECERVSIMLLDPKEEVLKVAVSLGLSKNLIKQETKPAKKSISARVFETGQALLVQDAASDDRVSASEFSSQYKTASFVVAPLRVGNKIVGTINANDKKSGEEFDRDDLFILRTMSHHVSAALTAAIHTSALEHDRERLSMLSDFQRILIHYLEPEEMLKELLKKCQEMMNVVSAAVFLKDEFSEDLVLRMGFNAQHEMTKQHTIHCGESITGLTARDGKIFLLNAPEKDPRYIAEIEWPYKGVIRNILTAPVRISNTTIGVIRLLNRRDGAFAPADAKLLRDVADSLSIAIRNMKLYEQLNRSVEEIIAANRNLEKLNDELNLKAKELEVMKKMMAKGSR